MFHFSQSVALENGVTFEFVGYTPISQNITRLAATLGCYGAFGTGGYTQEPCFLNSFRVALIITVSFGVGGCTTISGFLRPLGLRFILLFHLARLASLITLVSFGIGGYTHFSRFLRPLGLRFREWFHSVRAAILGTFVTFDQSGCT